MSDVLIRGMEMPKDGCHHMVCIYADGTVSTGGRVYMAVPVPPHGDLIERDALEAVVEQHYKHLKISRYDRDLLLHYLDIEMSPTIIPAKANEERREYEAQVEAAQYCEMYEPSYDPETGAL